jgi:DtxR family transcriptional regulator, Mn-dependent transcriptional regulator
MLSQTEENYLKCIYKLETDTSRAVLTNHIASAMRTTAGTVTDMIRRMSEKELVHYEKYKGVQLTEHGNRLATQLVRKHRLWEVFLHDKLGFAWDEVHDIAEELEHVSSIALIDRLDAWLDHPRFDPHGDPIPDAKGTIRARKQVILSSLHEQQTGVITGVNEHAPEFLSYLQSVGLVLGATVIVQTVFPYDCSMLIIRSDGSTVQISEKVSRNLFVQT